MDYKNLIRKVKSVRDYKNVTVNHEILYELKLFYKNEKKLIDNIELEVFVKSKDDIYEQLKGLAGYKEKMIEAPHYLIVLSEDKDHYIENTGYIFENVMLKAYELGVGSCWITFKDGDAIKKKLMINSDKKLTAIIALGYDDNKSKVVYENVSDYNPSKANIKKVEDNTSDRLGVEDIVFIKEWGKRATVDELTSRGILDGFYYGRLAPSTLNRQPWRFIVDDEVVVLAIRKDDYINSYEDKIDSGIVMLYFESIIDNTLFDVTWNLGKPEKVYNVPDDFLIVGYCNI